MKNELEQFQFYRLMNKKEDDVVQYLKVVRKVGTDEWYLVDMSVPLSSWIFPISSRVLNLYPTSRKSIGNNWKIYDHKLTKNESNILEENSKIRYKSFSNFKYAIIGYLVYVYSGIFNPNISSQNISLKICLITILIFLTSEITIIFGNLWFMFKFNQILKQLKINKNKKENFETNNKIFKNSEFLISIYLSQFILLLISTLILIIKKDINLYWVIIATIIVTVMCFSLISSPEIRKSNREMKEKYEIDEFIKIKEKNNFD